MEKGEYKTIPKKIAFEERVWYELQKRYPGKWEEYVNNLLEKDLFGNDLINWLQKKLEETPKKTVLSSFVAENLMCIILGIKMRMQYG